MAWRAGNRHARIALRARSAAAAIRLAEVEANVRKKMKDKAFARSVNRDDIINGAADLDVDLEEHIAFCIEAMKGIAAELGLAGS